MRAWHGGQWKMLKARGTMDGRDTVFLGLSFANLQKFKDEPLKTYILIDKNDLDMPFDIMIFSGQTEDELEVAFLKQAKKGSH